MSAFVLDKSHISAMLRKGLRRYQYGCLRWQHNEKQHLLTNETADQVGQMLLDENVKSVSYRYQGDTLAELPGRLDQEWLIPFTCNRSSFAKIPTAVECLKLISCYEYQSCEHPDWEESEAHAFCHALQKRAIITLPGYEDAPYDWQPKHDQAERPEYVKV